MLAMSQSQTEFTFPPDSRPPQRPFIKHPPPLPPPTPCDLTLKVLTRTAPGDGKYTEIGVIARAKYEEPQKLRRIYHSRMNDNTVELYFGLRLLERAADYVEREIERGEGEREKERVPTGQSDYWLHVGQQFIAGYFFTPCSSQVSAVIAWHEKSGVVVCGEYTP